MVRLDRTLTQEAFGARLLLQVHDELVLEAPAEEVPDLLATVRRVMEEAVRLKVHLAVDVGSGDNWLDAKK